MLNKTIGGPAPTTWGTLAALPYLDSYYTIEELQAWREKVAKIKEQIVLPKLGDEPDPDKARIHGNAAKVQMEQRMRAQADRDRKDPKQIAQRDHLARIELAQLDATIGRLQARRAEVAARITLGAK